MFFWIHVSVFSELSVEHVVGIRADVLSESMGYHFSLEEMGVQYRRIFIEGMLLYRFPIRRLKQVNDRG